MRPTSSARCARSRCSTGYGGAPPADVGALEDVLVRLSALAATHPEVTEIDCDPVRVGATGATVVGRPHPRPPAGAPRPFPALDR